MTTTDTERFMRRALQLARNGAGNASPNPMVGAVIVDSAGRIIGEGYHRRCGEGHAEVNAVASVKDPEALRDATMYVTLEPCSHYGKTPPCAQLIIDRGIPRVVVGCLDPFEKVSGRGVRMLKEAGVDVRVLDGPLNQACRDLNRRFMTAHSKHRPFITLKWAQSLDGYMDVKRPDEAPAYGFSTALGRLMVHRLRSLHDAILVGGDTWRRDRPQLNVRGWDGRNPRRVVLTSTEIDGVETVKNLDEVVHLYDKGITSILVEGGASTLRAFIDAGLWDDARVEIADVRLGDKGDAQAPLLPVMPCDSGEIDGNKIFYYRNMED